MLLFIPVIPFFVKAAIAVGTVGSGAYIFYKKIIKEPNQRIKNNEDKKKYLTDVLLTHSMSKVNSLTKTYREKREVIKAFLLSAYPREIYSIINSGSFAKSTAVNTKFDLDIVVAFKRDSFTTLGGMLETIYQQLREEYKDVANVRKQTVSVGVEFHENENGDRIQIDIVPGRELKQEQYINDKKLKLYINSDDPKQSIQTNISKQIEHIKGKAQERKIIKLLKIWKKHTGYPIKSFFLELAVIQSSKNREVSNDLWEQLKMTMEYIRDEVNTENFSLIDPGNSNNRVEDVLSPIEKEQLSKEMEAILANIEKDADSLTDYFPLNMKFVTNL